MQEFFDAIYEHFHVPVEAAPCKVEHFFTWCPKRRTIMVRTYLPFTSLVLHEVAHYWTATAKERSYPEFGLGTDREEGQRSVRAYLPRALRERREHVTEAVALFLAWYLWKHAPVLRRSVLPEFFNNFSGNTLLRTAAYKAHARRRVRRLGLEVWWPKYLKSIGQLRALLADVAILEDVLVDAPGSLVAKLEAKREHLFSKAEALYAGLRFLCLLWTANRRTGFGGGASLYCWGRVHYTPGLVGAVDAWARLRVCTHVQGG